MFPDARQFRICLLRICLLEKDAFSLTLAAYWRFWASGSCRPKVEDILVFGAGVEQYYRTV